MPKYKVPNFGPDGRPERLNTTALQHQGDLGVVYEEETKAWQIVQLVDAVTAVGDVVYWKSYTARTVTPTIGNSSRNEVAGVSEVVGAANNYIALRQKGLMNVKAKGAVTFARGENVFSDTGSNQVDHIAIGTAPTANSIGQAQADQSGGFVSVMLKIHPA